jgi:hypothetical protein
MALSNIRAPARQEARDHVNVKVPAFSGGQRRSEKRDDQHQMTEERLGPDQRGGGLGSPVPAEVHQISHHDLDERQPDQRSH